MKYQINATAPVLPFGQPVGTSIGCFRIIDSLPVPWNVLWKHPGEPAEKLPGEYPGELIGQSPGVLPGESHGEPPVEQPRESRGEFPGESHGLLIHSLVD